MIETREAGQRGRAEVDDDLSPPPCSRGSRDRRRPRTAAADSSSRSPRGGPTSTRRSRSTPLRRSRSAGCEHEEPIAGAGLPAGGGVLRRRARHRPRHLQRCRRRSSSVTPSSSVTASPDSGQQVQSGDLSAWRARLVAEATITLRLRSPRKQPRGSTPRSRPSPGRSAPPSSTGSWPRPSSGSSSPSLIRLLIPRTGGGTSTPATRPWTRTTSTSPAPCTSRPTSTSPSARPRPGLGPRCCGAEVTRVRPDSSTSAGPRPSVTSPAPRPRSTSSPRDSRGESQDGCLPHARSCSTPTSTPARAAGQTVFGPTGRLEEGQRLALLDQVQGWCGDSRTKVTIKPVIDLNSPPVRPRLRDPRPDPRTRHPPRPDVRLPVVHKASPWLRRRPRHRVRPRR